MAETDDKNNDGGKTKKAIADYLSQKKTGDSNKSVKGSFGNANQKTNTKVANNNFKRNKI